MNTKDYIESGVLEAVVLGSATPQEIQEVACLSKIYPEIMAEFQALQEAIGSYAAVHAKKPQSDLKNRIFAQMTFDSIEDSKKDDSEIFTINKPKISKSTNWFPRLSIAAAVFFAVLAGIGYMKFNDLEDKNRLLESNLNSQSSVLTLIKEPNTKTMMLSGVEKHPDGKVMVFWNQKTNDFKLKVDKLPTAPSGKQYQLWGIIDGKPVSMGMLQASNTAQVQHMTVPAGKVAAFAITLEKQGGSPTPTLEDMYVMGSV